MKKNINLQLSYYLIILFFFAAFFLFQKHHVANDSTISEWLINYEGGFVRRGLTGEFFFQIHELLNIHLGWLVFISVSVIYFSYCSMKKILSKNIS